jgi:septal ring factor EnvC (AmiA/AmiB activator)
MTTGARQFLGIALLAMALALPAAQKDRAQVEKERAQVQKDQKAVAKRLEQVRKQVARDATNLSKQERELRDAEVTVGRERSALRELNQQRAERAADRQELLEERSAKEAARARHQDELANQLRGAYFMGRSEPLQLLLNQRSTAQMSRMLTYYGYFGRLRAQQIEQLNQDVTRIEELTAKIEAEDTELAILERRQQAQVGKLDKALAERGKALALLEKEAKGRGQEQAQLEKQQRELKKRLEDLLEQLVRATESAPYDPNVPFARQKNRLAWPVAGTISTDFGERIAAEHRSDGIEIEARQGSEVRAIHEGRVEVAQYSSGRGYLVVLNHGDGFISVYGHNDELFRQPGDRVKAGDVIATVGESGGRKTPGLYFEIRSGYRDYSTGKPVNPHDWFRTKLPPAR